MVPRPPKLRDRIKLWQDRELFWIVKHGVKYTGMPAWPSQDRDDEVWAMVAFLKALPQLSDAQYQALIATQAVEFDAERASTSPVTANGAETVATGGISGADSKDTLSRSEKLLSQCQRCHNERNQTAKDPAFPIIAGMPKAYLLKTLNAFSEGHRTSGIMQAAVAEADQTILESIAEFYAGQDLANTIQACNQDSLAANYAETGARIARLGLPAKAVPACESCHGKASRARNKMMPKLDGLPAEYLQTQLELFKDKKRGGTPFANLMTTAVDGLPKKSVGQVAAYYAGRVCQPTQDTER